MHDLAGRLANRVQLTTDGRRAYLEAVEDAFGANIRLRAACEDLRRYSRGRRSALQPRNLHGNQAGVISGKPDFKHVSTSFVERQNLTMRMSMRRFTRLTNGFSKKLVNLAHAVALHYMHYNFCRIHQSLRVTPAMEAGVCDHVWSIDDVIALLN